MTFVLRFARRVFSCDRAAQARGGAGGCTAGQFKAPGHVSSGNTNSVAQFRPNIL